MRRKFFEIESIPSICAKGYSFLVSRNRITKEIYEEIAEEVVSKISSGKVLDVGTGPGFLPIIIAKKAPEIEITGIDLSAGMVKLARKNAMKTKLSERVKFFKTNASSMPFENEFFDFVISTFSFHHWLKPVDCLKEILRVLKKGGEAWIYDIRKDIQKMAGKQFKSEYGLFYYWVLQIIKIHSSVSLKILEEILRNEIGFLHKVIEDKGILIKIKIFK